MSFLCWLGRETCASLGLGRVHCRHQAKLIGPDLAKRLAHVSVTPSQLAQKHLNSVKLFCCQLHLPTYTPTLANTLPTRVLRVTLGVSDRNVIEAESNPAKPKPQPEPKQLKNHHCRMVIPFAIRIHASPSLCRGPRLFLSVQHSLFLSHPDPRGSPTLQGVFRVDLEKSKTAC